MFSVSSNNAVFVNTRDPNEYNIQTVFDYKNGKLVLCRFNNVRVIYQIPRYRVIPIQIELYDNSENKDVGTRPSF